MQFDARSTNSRHIRWGVVAAVLCVSIFVAYVGVFIYNTVGEGHNLGERSESRSTPPVLDSLDPALDARVRAYKALFSSGQYEAGIDEAEKLRPQLESFVSANPKNAAGHLELSGAYLAPMFVAAYSLPPGSKKGLTMVKAVQNDDLEKGRQELEEFQRLAPPNDPRTGSVQQLSALLAKLQSTVGQSTAPADGASSAATGMPTGDSSKKPDCPGQDVAACVQVNEGRNPYGRKFTSDEFNTVIAHCAELKKRGCYTCSGDFANRKCSVTPR